MEKCPKKISRSFLPRPGKTMEVTIWVVNREWDDREIMNGIAFIEQAVYSPEKAFAKPSRLRTIITS